MFLRLKLWLTRMRAPKEERAELKKRHHEHLRRYSQNCPRYFPRVRDDEGDPVGPPIEVEFVTLHDMQSHAVHGELTNLVLLDGLRINAWREGGFERLGDLHGVVTIQPVWAQVTVHAVEDRFKAALCGFSGKSWKDWPKDHRRVHIDGEESITCPTCIQRLSKQRCAA